MEVIVKYHVFESFNVPEGIDLHDTTQVKSWYVKWNVLHIEMKDGREIEVQGEGYTETHDYKRPESTKVVKEGEDECDVEWE